MTTHRVAGIEPPADGELTLIEVGGRQLVLAGAEGAVYALDDECTHAACSLSTGELEGATLVCPCHFAEYDVHDGAVLGGPAPRALQTYAAAVVDGELEIDVPE